MKRRLGLLVTIPVVGAFALSAATAVPASAADRTMCGKVLTKNTKLVTDVGPCTGDGLIIGADGITLDLNGHRLFGKLSASPGTASNTANARGVTFRMTRGATVMNGEITRFAVGVAIDGGSSNRVTTLNVHDNIGTDDGDGITVNGSNSNQITRNRVIHNGQWSGVSLLGGPGNTGSNMNVIADNVIRDNNIPMFDMSGAAIDKRDIGIAVEGPGATHNQVLRNTVAGSGTVGIQVFPACSDGYNIAGGCPGTVPNNDNLISGNTVTGNGFGAPLSGALGDGIALLAMGPPVVHMPAHNSVTNNSVSGNQRNGISLGGGNGQELNDEPWTTGGENYGCFISADPDDPVVDTPNLCGASYNTVTGNTATRNGVTGIFLGPRSDNNVISQNTADNNARDGVGLGLAVVYGPGQLPVLDPQGNLQFVAGSGPRNNVLSRNRGSGNGRFDGFDQNPNCGSNRWVQSLFMTVNQPCVMG